MLPTDSFNENKSVATRYTTILLISEIYLDSLHFLKDYIQFNGLLTSPCWHTVKMKSNDRQKKYYYIRAIACKIVLYNTS